MKSNSTPHQKHLVTALALTAILSVSSGLTLIDHAAANSVNLLVNSNEGLKENPKPNLLPSSVANAVLQDAAKRSGIPAKQLKIKKYTQKTWNNGCLGISKPNEFCTQSLVSGWLVVVSHDKQIWTYHTNQNGSSLRLEPVNRLKNAVSVLPKSVKDIKPVTIPPQELPAPLDQNIVFREIASGGITGRTYQTTLLKDRQLIRVRIGDANDSERSVRKISEGDWTKFRESLQKNNFGKFKNQSYPAPSGSADYITYTLTSQDGTVQYNDISRSSLPKKLQSIVEVWNEIKTKP